VGLARLRFSSGNSDVMVPAHGFSHSVELAQILRCLVEVFINLLQAENFKSKNLAAAPANQSPH